MIAQHQAGEQWEARFASLEDVIRQISAGAPPAAQASSGEKGGDQALSANSH